VVKGRIVKIDDRTAYIDVGYKVEAVMPREELPPQAKEGDEIKGILVKFSSGCARSVFPKVSQGEAL
jgi:small subunit ribosomal protein S1